MSLIIGLTGGIASGKTTVANLFHEHFNIDIVDADIAAREVVTIGSKGLEKISHHFGSEILLADGHLNRMKLRDIIFSNPDEKQWLNELLHPMIRQKIERDLATIRSPYGLLVAPLLIENNMQSMANRVLVIDVSPEEQINRTVIRDNVAPEQVGAILKSQASRELRLSFADDVVTNNTKNQKLLPQITKLHQKYLAINVENRSK